MKRNIIIVISITLIIIIVTILTVWINKNNDGIIKGVVLDMGGNEVKNAEVVLREKIMTHIMDEEYVTNTGDDGEFNFKNMKIIEFIIYANKTNYNQSDKKSYHLYFKGQNFEIPEPIILERK